MPEGKLLCAKNGKRYKWYLSNGSNPIYLKKKEKHLAEQLAEKKYLQLKKEDLLLELKAINSYLRIKSKTNDAADKLLTEASGYSALLKEKFKVESEELFKWQTEEYVKNNNFIENLKHRTSSGGMVRSKSEVIIDTVLYKNKIPYRYECALKLGGRIVYPDFTIRHPKTGEIFYWEHFGAMDDPNYYKNVFSKLEEYTAHGIVPNINLITTYETAEYPLGIYEVENMVERYFL